MSHPSFSSLTLPSELLHNLNELGYTQMTPIQAESLPLILANRDVIAQAKTGSGKTAAFGLGLVMKLQVKQFEVQSLVLCPTRELADQVAKELRRLARYQHNVKVLTLCGGAAFGPQLGSLRHGAHIVVGTPGRVLEHLKKGSLQLKALNTLVLDEADRMLDMGFIEEIEKVISYAPAKRQSLLFSATFPEKIELLSDSIQQEAVRVSVQETEQPPAISEHFYQTDHKLETLIGILAKYRPETCIVFANTKVHTQQIAEDLRKCHIDALAIHGDLEQYERTDVLVQFMNRSCPVLVATDVAARGLDIKDLELVVNYDMPHTMATYTHRIGRTGRAGKEGLACSLYSSAAEIQEYEGAKYIFESQADLPDTGEFRLQPLNVTLVIEGGKKEKMRPGDILGALTGDAGLPSDAIGKIDIYEKQSYVAIKADHIHKAHKQLKQGKIKGRKFSVWILE